MWLVVVVVVLVVVVLVLVVMVVVSVLLLFSAPLAYLHSYLRWISEGNSFTFRYIAQAATPLHPATLNGIGSARDGHTLADIMRMKLFVPCLSAW